MKINYTFITCLFMITSIWSSCDKKNQSTAPQELNNLYDSFSYAVGFQYGLQLKQRFIKEVNFDALVAGFKEGLDKDSNFTFTPEVYDELVGRFMESVQEEASAYHMNKSKEMVEKLSKATGVNRTSSGMFWKSIEEGEGISPTITDTVSIHFSLELEDGRMVENTEELGRPVKVVVASAWPGMVEGLLMMREGAEYEFYVPFELGFGKKPVVKGVPPNAAIIYSIKMLKIYPAKES
jgi:FKBP-type peptidyl-prolyl cis-trans isomerase